MMMRMSRRIALLVLMMVGALVATGGGGALASDINITKVVTSWGDNSFGQLGNGTNNHSNDAGRVKGLSSTELTALDAGDYHSLALKSDGTVRAWGDNGSGQLGNGITNTDSNVPVQVSNNLSGVKAVSAGAFHSLAK